MSLMCVNTFFYSCHVFLPPKTSNYFAIDLSILLRSALVNTVAFLKPLFLLAAFLVRMWLLYALFLLILPDPVNFILLQAPLWDFILFFAMMIFSSYILKYIFFSYINLALGLVSYLSVLGPRTIVKLRPSNKGFFSIMPTSATASAKAFITSIPFAV